MKYNIKKHYLCNITKVVQEPMLGMKHKIKQVRINSYGPEKTPQNPFLIFSSKVLKGRVSRISGKYPGLGAKRSEFCSPLDI